MNCMKRLKKKIKTCICIIITNMFLLIDIQEQLNFIEYLKSRINLIRNFI